MVRANGEGQKREYWLNKKIVKGRKQIRKEEAANKEGGKKEKCSEKLHRKV